MGIRYHNNFLQPASLSVPSYNWYNDVPMEISFKTSIEVSGTTLEVSCSSRTTPGQRTRCTLSSPKYVFELVHQLIERCGELPCRIRITFGSVISHCEVSWDWTRRPEWRLRRVCVCVWMKCMCETYDDPRSVLALHNRIQKPVIDSVHIDRNQSQIFWYVVLSKQRVQRRFSMLLLTCDFHIRTLKSWATFFVQFSKRLESFLVSLCSCVWMSVKCSCVTFIISMITYLHEETARPSGR